MERLSTEVGRALEQLGPGGSIGRVVEAWPAAVGAQLAAHAWPARITRDGTLVVYARDSIWAFELTQQATEIRARLGEDAIAAVKFVPGPLPEAGPKPPPESSREVPQPGPAELSAAATLAADIADEKLRERVSKAAALSLARAAADRTF